MVIRPFGKVGITATQLKLNPGDIVEVLEKYPVGYWRGRCLGKEGIFDTDCCVPCTASGEALKPLVAALDSSFVAAEKNNFLDDQYDAETSESQVEDSAGILLRNQRSKGGSLRKEQQDGPSEVDESLESTSVMVDPHLLDSIGESPRGVLRMLNDSKNRRAPSPSLSPSSSLRQSASAPNTIAKLNIGGCRFTTTTHTLTTYPHSMLAAMFGGRYKPVLDEDGHYFIDRDGTNFRYILNFLRDGTVVLPTDLKKRKEILKEAIYYQVCLHCYSLFKL